MGSAPSSGFSSDRVKSRQEGWNGSKPSPNAASIDYEALCRQHLPRGQNSFSKISRSISSSMTSPSTSTRSCIISDDFMKVILYSWHYIKSSIALNGKGAQLLITRTLETLQFIDEEGTILMILQRSHKSALILLRMVQYVVHLKPNDSFSFKSKIRAMGRAHARIGIDENKLGMFNEAFMRALSSVLQLTNFTVQESNEVVNIWRKLMFFVTEQMAFDKVIFVQHSSLTANGEDFGDQEHDEDGDGDADGDGDGDSIEILEDDEDGIFNREVPCNSIQNERAIHFEVNPGGIKDVDEIHK